MFRWLLRGGLVLMLGLTACAAMSQGAPTTVSTLPTSPLLSPAPTPPLSQLSPMPTPESVPLKSPASSWAAQADAAVHAAINDLTAKRQLAPESVQVVSVEATDWPDTSLGCPQPGVFYAQIIVQGYKIVLSSGGQSVEYHSDMKGRVVTCSPAINPSSADDVSGRAILDLASRLGISSDRITIERVESDEFPAGGLGCTQSGQPQRAIPAIISGQRIILRAADKTYEYRASGTELVYCGMR
jgi:hypothetical protein